ncbi:MAG: T9SS type A sorting domain-containing protein [Muribaculaceae bacterium]|nr:T9SS type A sorting domain-containing protein [Muribaculaceae bacterium]
MRRLMSILLLLVLLQICIPVATAQLQWRESTTKVQGKSLTDPALTDGIEIYGANGVITIKTVHRFQVRVFTILGQLVSQATLNAGVSELRINARGIYLVKIGNLTQKVAL